MVKYSSKSVWVGGGVTWLQTFSSTDIIGERWHPLTRFGKQKHLLFLRDILNHHASGARLLPGQLLPVLPALGRLSVFFFFPQKDSGLRKQGTINVSVTSAPRKGKHVSRTGCFPYLHGHDLISPTWPLSSVYYACTTDKWEKLRLANFVTCPRSHLVSVREWIWTYTF